MWLLLILTIGIFGYVFVGIAQSHRIQDEDLKDAIEKWKKQTSDRF